ncbi:MAG: methyl-accepting chemotaxis protein [Burkholderiaceae bacterium]
MRKNLPVTDVEFRLKAGTTLVSATDEKGRIVSCNPAFVEASGFAEDELLGQPHNLIRHPDMPEEAFRDMWATIQAGGLWRAVVKNRRKDGSFYWVSANVTPLKHDDRIVGYLSVRAVPGRDEIAAAERLYALMRSEQEAGRPVHKLAGGRLWRDTLWGRLRDAADLGLEGRLGLLGFTMVAIVLGTGVTLRQFAAPLWLELLAVPSLAALVGQALRRIIARPVRDIESFACGLAACDLTRPFDDRRAGVLRELGMALTQVSQNVRAVMNDNRNEIEALRSTVGELSEAKLELSRRTESQASAIEQTASAMEQMTASVRSSAEQARRAAETAIEAREVTDRSHHAVGEVVTTMDQIGAASHRVTDIIQVIESIAFQTNILALNASVEAARAGEQGRGFAVVASEVRGLAQRSANAAKEIRDLIAEAGDRVQAGLKVTHAARETIDEALEQVATMGRLAGEIAEGASEQSVGISQVNEAIGHMDVVTQQNAAMVEELAASAGALSEQANVLAENVRLFRLSESDSFGRTESAVSMRKAAKTRAMAGAH